MANLLQLAGMLALCLGTTLFMFAFLGVLPACAMLATGLGLTMFKVGIDLEHSEEGDYVEVYPR